MGNSAVKEKSRHFSGDDAGPTMATRSEDEYIFRAAGIPSPSEEFTSSYNVSSFVIARKRSLGQGNVFTGVCLSTRVVVEGNVC